MKITLKNCRFVKTLVALSNDIRNMSRQFSGEINLSPPFFMKFVVFFKYAKNIDEL